ncbi:SDR family NAD(P)-dependent oxidoreductase [Aquabacterium sp. A7-Y]|uniref:SDR family NAD(P)-dependent oxidoreductase n=1 Tax=Aquabacterium sp. A7-Y TaxID=1349605 RepID=UPI00223D5C38|nr:SDR family NAD(P)-dependent oxidoreductase [Aquabacterium sp. A7-Y]MCW7539900.1 SDR family NAD(P)-dependent oxidoreductase [Aquabacterium sp. A7-Y]
MSDLREQTVVVTGAAGHLGRAVAAAFDARGAQLVLLDRERAALQQVYGGETPRRLFVAADLLDAAQVESALRSAHERHGRIDVLCNLAGGFRMGEAVHETSARTWDFLMDINARTVLHAVAAAVPWMQKAGQGRIVNVAAGAAQRGMAQMGAYCASKSAVIRLTESMAAELREQGINVNCVLPTIIDTPDNRAAMPDADPGRWVAPADLAEVIVFLASPAARAVHGAALPVSGLS